MSNYVCHDGVSALGITLLSAVGVERPKNPAGGFRSTSNYQRAIPKPLNTRVRAIFKMAMIFLIKVYSSIVHFNNYVQLETHLAIDEVPLFHEKNISFFCL